MVLQGSYIMTLCNFRNDYQYLQNIRLILHIVSKNAITNKNDHAQFSS